jgi:alginate O-acetyltransferase complex protein AlgI
MRGFGLHLPTPKIALPLGISFFTFHCISYITDVYRRRFAANRSPSEVALYIALFPQLVAGPIVRYKTVARQLRWRRHSLRLIETGIRMFIIGLAQKVIIADSVAPLARAAFDRTSDPSMIDAWLGVVSYTIQIYFDFAGYSTMAVGLGLILGFSLPRNFRLPYTALSVREFWQRWHMSLSGWLRDYLYIPLGGSRGGSWQTYRNLVIVFLLCGLWHGASWNFVIWGGYHGGLLSLERMMGRREFEKKPPLWLYPVRALITFALVCVGWVFFRAATFADSRYVLSQLVHGGKQMQALLPRWLVYMTGASLLIAVIEEKFGWTDRLSRGPAWAYAAFMIVLLLTIEMIGVTEKALPFVYFQF